MSTNFLTPGQAQRQKRNDAIRKEYAELTANDGQSRTEVAKFLMKKHGIFSMSTIYAILKGGGEES